MNSLRDDNDGDDGSSDEHAMQTSPTSGSNDLGGSSTNGNSDDIDNDDNNGDNNHDDNYVMDNAANKDDDDSEQLFEADPTEEDIGLPLQTFICKWRGKEYPITIPINATVGDLKAILEVETDVLAKRQKILGLVKGRLPPDDTKIEVLLPLPNAGKFTMMGTPEEGIVKDPNEIDDLPDVINDLSWDFKASNASEVKYRPENQMKLQRRIRHINVNVMNELRPGKKLLVLDLDYTLWDHKSKTESLELLKRPFMDDFLATAYEDYDLVVWSQTSWRWLEAKLTELGILTNTRYSIAFVLDRSSMFSINSRVGGKERTHEVKALDIIWAKFPQFSAKNTIHIDDLARNGAMNPQSLLKIKAYRNGPTARATDKELVFLARYLKIISAREDFTKLDHDKWKEFLVKQ